MENHWKFALLSAGDGLTDGEGDGSTDGDGDGTNPEAVKEIFN